MSKASSILLLLTSVVVALNAQHIDTKNTHPELVKAQSDLHELLDSQTRRIQEAEEYVSILMEMQQEHSVLQEQETSLVERMSTLNQLLQRVQGAQLQALAKRLNDTVQAELASRQAPQEITTEKENGTEVDSLRNSLEIDRRIQDAQEAMQNWMAHTMQLHVMELQESQVKASKSRSESSCISPAEGALLVQEALQTHFGGKELPLTVVHHLTSPTYQIPEKLGAVWWRRCIPDDIERLLPFGWRDWNVGLPSSLRRYFNLDASTLPPEAILDPNITPGACWPMAGSEGYITFLLDQPTRVDELTLYSMHTSSTPRKVRLIGYPTCVGGQCLGLEFDVEKPKILAEMEYKLQGNLVQSMKVGHMLENQESSCSEECTGDHAPSTNTMDEKIDDEVRGIRLEIESNWGHEDYTCLYRVVLKESAEAN